MYMYNLRPSMKVVYQNNLHCFYENIKASFFIISQVNNSPDFIDQVM